MRGQLGRPAVMVVAVAVATILTAPVQAGEEVVSGEQVIYGAEQELGARLGVATGGRVTPGGLHVAGIYLYQLTDADWFEGALSFTVGGGNAACFADREGQFMCDHGIMNGRAVQVSGGVRRFFQPQKQFTPFLAALAGLRLISYPDDDVRGIAIPITAAAGVRARINELVTVSGGAAVELGVGWLNRDLGAEPVAGLVVHAGVEFQLR